MSVAYLDTHVAIWLHDGLVEKLSGAARDAIERNDLRISPMVYVEFDYLYRRKRIRLTAAEIGANLAATFGIVLCSFPFPAIAVEAVGCGWTSDPFDRIIVGHAEANQQAPLITADETIRRHYARAVW